MVYLLFVFALTLSVRFVSSHHFSGVARGVLSSKNREQDADLYQLPLI